MGYGERRKTSSKIGPNPRDLAGMGRAGQRATWVSAIKRWRKLEREAEKGAGEAGEKCRSGRKEEDPIWAQGRGEMGSGDRDVENSGEVELGRERK